MIGHIGGVPLEEIVLPLMSGVGTTLLVALSRVRARIRRDRS